MIPFKTHYILILFTVITISSCTHTSDSSLSDIVLHDLDHNEIHLSLTGDNGIMAFFFLSPECPFCINYTKTISEVIDDNKFNKVTFYAIYPGTYYSNEEIAMFHKEYNFNIDVLTDPDLKLTRMLQATVTPEVIIIDSNGEIAYSGAIDNWAVDTGVKRQVITEHYLADALESVISGNSPKISKTKPVGCYIEL